MLLEDAESEVMRYIHMGVPCGGFIRMIIENDLMGAMGKADDDSRLIVFDICQVVYTQCPMPARNSPEAYKAWIDAGIEWRKRHPDTPTGDCTKQDLSQVHYEIQQAKEDSGE